MKKYFEKYKEHLKFIINSQRLADMRHLVEKNKLRTLFYNYGVETFLILFEYYHNEEEYEICAKFRDQLKVMNKTEGKDLPESMAEFIEKSHANS